MRRTKNEFMDEEWEFDSYDEMVTAADTEGRVCGDDIRKSDDRKTIEIFNHHRCSVRWKGFLKILLITLAVSLGGCQSAGYCDMEYDIFDVNSDCVRY